MFVTPLEMTMFVKALHPLNILGPTDLTPSDIMTSAKL